MGVGLDVIEYACFHYEALVLFLVGRIGEIFGGRLLLFFLFHVVFLLGGLVVLGDSVSKVSETVINDFQLKFSSCVWFPSNKILLLDYF